MIRVGIVGAGIGAEHLEGYHARPHAFSVRAICDLNLARAKALAGETIAATTELDDLLDDPDIDLIDVCLPPHLHVETALAALAAGKHVICEKPLALSLAEIDTLEDASRAARREVFPVFQYRFGPAGQALDALKAAGLLGPPVMAAVETHWNRDAEYYAVPWRGTWAGEAGGAVLSHAIHAHDFLCHRFGPVRQVAALLATQVNPIETEDCAAVAIGFENGALATSSITLGAARDETRLRLVYRDLTATSGRLPYRPAEAAWQFTARDPDAQEAVDEVLRSVPTGAPAGFAGLFSAIAQALDGRPGPEVSLADGRRSIELVTAIYLAGRSGKTTTLPLDPNAASYKGWTPGAGKSET